jgi:hypothetical protein
MIQERIYIAVSCHNRRQIAEQCLPTLRASVGDQDVFVCRNDGSVEYDTHWLRQWADRAIEASPSGLPLGIEANRRIQLHEFWESDCDLLYFTDHDTIHDISWREYALHLREKYGDILIGLYNTQAHERLAGNTRIDDPQSEVIIRRYAPGVSYLLSRNHVKILLPVVGQITAFDWQIPDLLGNHCAISRISYLDHIGLGGLRHPINEGPDGGDRATSPTEFLIQKRREIVAALSKG